MAFNYEYKNTGNVQIQNIRGGFDKRNGKVFFDFEVKGADWDTSDSNYIDAHIRYGGVSKASQAVKRIKFRDVWKKERVEWEAGKELNNQNLGAQDVVLRIEDENNVNQDTTKSITIDLDPNEFKLTSEHPPSFGGTATPDIKWALKNLFSEQHMVPTVAVTGGSSSTALAITFDDDTSVSGLSSGVVNLNGVTFGDSSLTMNSTEAGRAYFKNIKQYKITSPTMTLGSNTYTITLNCTAI
tara:strand:- start:445 stop:1167 length:723 start_codon:yes stop_codon:yes gene_type:complete